MTIPQAFELALRRHSAGQLADAEALYRQILAAEPRHFQAMRLLGAIAQQDGRHELALEWMRQSIVLDPNEPAAHCVLGEVLHALGRLGEAIAAYRQATELKPDFAEAHNNLGNAYRAQGQLDNAVAAYRRALLLKPDLAETHNNLGLALTARGQFDEAVVECRWALELKPGYVEAHNNLAAALAALGRLDEAIAIYRRALQLNPGFAAAWNDLGVALKERGDSDAAIAAYRRALELKPESPEAHNNLGIALKEQGQLDQAISAFRQAIQLDPDCAEALNNLGNALRDRGEWEDAVAALRHALRMKPSHSGFHSNLIFALHFHPRGGEETVIVEQQRWNHQFSDPLIPFLQPHGKDRAPERRLRVGYVSPDFRDHAVGRFVLPLLECHDPERIEVFCYSGVASPDWMTANLRARAMGWRSTVGVSDERLAGMIRDDGVDILVDLAMHTAGNRLPMFAHRPAPVQAAWLAYPGRTGLHCIDFRLTDARMDPPGVEPAGDFEEPVRLPDSWCCYQPAMESPEVNVLPAMSAGVFTFGSLNAFTKVHDGVLALWARMLETVKGSRLIMLCPEGRGRERVRAFFAARGLAAERVELVGFVSRRDYLELYQRIDLALDPFPHNGMATTCDALWMGAPVLTLPGATPASRAGLSLLSSVRLQEFAASSEVNYLEIAVALAMDLPRLADLRARLRHRMQASPLMDAPRFARNVEAAYRAMWQRWLRQPAAS